MSKLLDEAELKPSEHLVKHLETLYDQYCEKLDRDKLLKNFYKLMSESKNMFITKSKNMTVPAYNLILIQIPDLLVGFYKHGNVKEKLPDIKPIEKSEFGPCCMLLDMSFQRCIAKVKFLPRKILQNNWNFSPLLLSMKSLQDNEYIDSLSQGKLWNPCKNLLAITAECEKLFRQHSAGLVHEIPLQQVREDILQKPKVKSAWDAILFDVSLAKSKTSVTDVCLENIVMLYIHVRSSYSKDVVTKMTIKEKAKFHK